MKVKVHQLNREAYRDSTCIFGDDTRETFATKAYLDGKTEVVLDIEILDDAFKLQDFYSLTNSYETPWTDRYHDRNLPQGRRIRSTSVCDIIEVDGVKYMVAGCGFNALDIPKGA